MYVGSSVGVSDGIDNGLVNIVDSGLNESGVGVLIELLISTLI